MEGSPAPAHAIAVPTQTLAPRQPTQAPLLPPAPPGWQRRQWEQQEAGEAGERQDTAAPATPFRPARRTRTCIHSGQVGLAGHRRQADVFPGHHLIPQVLHRLYVVEVSPAHPRLAVPAAQPGRDKEVAAGMCEGWPAAGLRRPRQQQSMPRPGRPQPPSTLPPAGCHAGGRHAPGLCGVLDDVLEVVAVAHVVVHGVGALAQPVLAVDVKVRVDLCGRGQGRGFAVARER